MCDIERRLTDAGYNLPSLPQANGEYITAIVVGDMLYTSGQLSRLAEGVLLGPIDKGEDISVAITAAEICALRCLAVAKEQLGSLKHINQVVSVRGFIASTKDFRNHSIVLDGASKVLLTAWPSSNGQHTRTAVGVSSLPSGGLVEIEATFSIK
jgi:enamine deaminase RidA (YjgF/YER057c/UK114 family)